MKKKTKKKKDTFELETTSETTGTIPIEVVTEPIIEVKKVNRLDVGFPNEDMNKVVAKLNEVIDKIND